MQWCLSHDGLTGVNLESTAASLRRRQTIGVDAATLIFYPAGPLAFPRKEGTCAAALYWIKPSVHSPSRLVLFTHADRGCPGSRQITSFHTTCRLTEDGTGKFLHANHILFAELCPLSNFFAHQLSKEDFYLVPITGGDRRTG